MYFILVRKICYLCNVNTTLHVYAAPTGSPSIQSFLITSDTTAELNWQPPPPLEQNGVIVDYSIELCSNRTGRVVKVSDFIRVFGFMFFLALTRTDFTLQTSILGFYATRRGAGPTAL